MSENFSDNAPKLPSHIAYSVEDGKGDQRHWQKVGAAWPTKEDGLSLKLSAIPLSGNIVLRSREALEAMREERKQDHSMEQEQAMKP